MEAQKKTKVLLSAPNQREDTENLPTENLQSSERLNTGSTGDGARNREVRSENAAVERPLRGKVRNNVRKLRTERMMSKAELARRAGVSTLTVDRVERGMSCRMDTKRKILEALGLRPEDRAKVFGDTEDDEG